MRFLQVLTICALAGCPLALAPPEASAGVFGDGDPANGVEDSRIALGAVARRTHGLEGWRLAPGTLECDGRLRGTALPLNLAPFGVEPEGLILLTAAHVLYDLDSRQPFAGCQFHHLGLAELPGYRHDIDLSIRLMGDFDPHDDRNDPGFGNGDWAFLYVPGPLPENQKSGRLTLMPFSATDFGDGNTSFRMLGWNASQGELQLSGRCRVIESGPGDLGGGAWRGQLLDDCDSGQGASGGGYLVIEGADVRLVGIRTGAHWDPGVFPGGRFPAGPPAGSVWHPGHNTNFGRAVDAEMVEALRQFIERIPRVNAH